MERAQSPEPIVGRLGAWGVKVRSDGRLEGRRTIPREFGTPRRKTLYARGPTYPKARAELRRVIRDWEDELLVGRQRPSSSQPLGALLDTWLERRQPGTPTKHAKRGLAHSTCVGYETHVRLHIRPYLGAIRLSELDDARIEDWLAERQHAGLSAAMCGKVLATLTAALQWGVERGWLERNPATLVVAPARPRRAEFRPLDSDELRGVLAAIAGHRLAPLFILALTMGPRLGELIGLRRSDLDLEAGTLEINHTLTWVGAAPILKDTKTPKSQRTIALPEMVVRALRDHLARQAEERRAKGDAWEDWDLLFTRANGRPLRGDGTGGVGDQFKRCLRRAGLRAMHFHELRHQAASVLLALTGNDYFAVARILGHSTYKLTLDLYGHLMAEVARLHAERVDDFYLTLAAHRAGVNLGSAGGEDGVLSTIAG